MGIIKRGEIRPYKHISPSSLCDFIIREGLLTKKENYDSENLYGINWEFITADLYMEIPERITDEIIDMAYEILEKRLRNNKIGITLAL
tara:strand:- start:4172 stop:4438 length:267 start_codon:yes stop_codon:yes gene_type:complete